MLLSKFSINSDKRLVIQDSKLKLDAAIYAYEVGYFRFNWHTSIEIMTVLNGSLLVFAEGQTRELVPDDVVVINSNVGHATMLTRPNTIAMVLRIEPEIYAEFLSDKQKILLHCNSNDETRYTPVFCLIRRNMAQIYSELSQNSTTGNMFAKGAILNVCATLIRHFSPEVVDDVAAMANAKQVKKLKQVIAYTEKHYQEKISMDKIAQLLAMNKTYASTFFRTYMGISYHDYLTRTRLNHAAHLINNTQYALIDVAIESGFSDAKGLHIAFKRYFGLSPNQYRKKIDWKLYPDTDKLFPILLDIHHPIIRNKVGLYLGTKPNDAGSA